ncbi:hypothetical protein [Pedobacter sp. WC2423]
MKRNKLTLLKLKLTPLYEITIVKKKVRNDLPTDTTWPGETLANTVSSFL